MLLKIQLSTFLHRLRCLDLRALLRIAWTEYMQIKFQNSKPLLLVLLLKLSGMKIKTLCKAETKEV